jgi:alkaline phosphatase D
MPKGASKSHDRIHFGSCNSQHYEQVLWPHVSARRAAAFVWAGDAVYGDDFEYLSSKKKFFSYWWRAKKKQIKEATPSVLHNLYREQLLHPGYRALLSAHHDNISNNSNNGRPPVVVMGTFDDHDYGRNNGDQTYQYRRESAVAYMDFIEQSNQYYYYNLMNTNTSFNNSSSSRWNVMKERAAAGKGLFGVKVLDFRRPVGQQLLTDAEAGLDPTVITAVEGHLSDRSVAIFLLDCRSHKTPWIEEQSSSTNKQQQSSSSVKSDLNYQGDFLGQEQWDWFEQAIGRSTAAVNLVVQGLQVHPERYFDGHLVENWGRFPKARHRLYQAVLQPNVKAPILISGDVHMAEISRRDCRRQEIDTTTNSRFLLEVTSSGMTHSWGNGLCARPRESSLCQSPYFQMSMRAGMHLAHLNGAWTEVVTLDHRNAHEGAKAGVQYSLDRNFGELEFDWEKRQVILRILGEDDSAPPLLSTIWDFDKLSGRTSIEETGKVSAADYDKVFNDLLSHNVATSKDWICINHRGLPSEKLQLFGVASALSFSMFLLLIPIVFPVLLACFLMRSKLQKRLLSS